MNIGERIKQRREELGVSVDELAKRLGKHRATIYRYESNEIANLPTSVLEPLAIALDTTPAALMGWKDDSQTESIFNIDNIFPLETQKIPLLGNIACGEPIYADEQFEFYVMAGTEIKADFCLRAQGDSMIGARINDGDIVFIRKQEMVEDGEIAAVLIGDETTLKRVYYDREAGILSLFAENPKFKTKRFSGDELNQIKILGKAIAFQSEIQ